MGEIRKYFFFTVICACVALGVYRSRNSCYVAVYLLQGSLSDPLAAVCPEDSPTIAPTMAPTTVKTSAPIRLSTSAPTNAPGPATTSEPTLLPTSNGHASNGQLLFSTLLAGASVAMALL
jgi:hypothetical protein